MLWSWSSNDDICRGFQKGIQSILLDMVGPMMEIVVKDIVMGALYRMTKTLDGYTLQEKICLITGHDITNCVRTMSKHVWKRKGASKFNPVYLKRLFTPNIC